MTPGALPDLEARIAACRDGRLGEGGGMVSGIKITLRESPNAWAAYEADIP